MQHRPHTDERLGQRGPQNLVRYFMLLMSVVYVGLGLYLWLAPQTALTLGNTPRQLLAAVFVFYGIIRFVRTYQQHFKRNPNDAR
ncbi:hypothetical protein [Hymenobacter weizhouensis]|uniref:hypothetical protein n=1 Tax=Hymenobacter sp. YIM 151500-1 TaxID=2987689 RepID=UPI002227EFEB|nr:hypothetical protein [Hymenobacter sp. YIM 151500-1]UYZ61839.1 hypothetical protein OIS53_12595 [Hymenobacter sp. YIM 151500-1]